MKTSEYLFKEEEELSDFNVNLIDIKEGEDLDMENEGESIKMEMKRKFRF